MEPETTLQETLVFTGRTLNFCLRQVRLADGSLLEREIVKSNGAVVIVPLDDDHSVRMVRQYRAAAGRWVLELPAGGLNPDEDPAQAAVRELLEETGDRAATWLPLGGFYTAPGTLTEYLHLYLASELTPGPNRPEKDEFIDVITLPWQTAVAQIRNGEIEDAKTIAGLLKAGLVLDLPLD